jgi:hypothetical protein
MIAAFRSMRSAKFGSLGEPQASPGQARCLNRQNEAGQAGLDFRRLDRRVRFGALLQH